MQSASQISQLSPNFIDSLGERLASQCAEDREDGKESELEWQLAVSFNGTWQEAAWFDTAVDQYDLFGRPRPGCRS